MEVSQFFDRELHLKILKDSLLLFLLTRFQKENKSVLEQKIFLNVDTQKLFQSKHKLFQKEQKLAFSSNLVNLVALGDLLKAYCDFVGHFVALQGLVRMNVA